MNRNCAVIIVAGGKSTRMRIDKRKLPHRGKTLLEATIERGKALSDEVILALSGPSDAYHQLKVVFDREQGKGPLMGLYSGLLETEKDLALLLPCDMPLVPVEFLRNLLSLASGYDITITRHRNTFQPLCAAYSRRVIPDIEEQLKEGDYSLVSLLQSRTLRSRVVGIEELTSYNNCGFPFININTPEDYSFLKSSPSFGF